MRLEDNYFDIIKELERRYGSLSDVPENKQALVFVRRHATTEDPEYQAQKGRRKAWTDDDDDYLRKNYEAMEREIMWEIVSRTT